MKRLIKIQSELKAPKNQFNKFGNYKYRNNEDILEAVKPLLKEQGLLLTISDEITLIGDRYYLKATATVRDSNNNFIANCSALARESLDKKGMDSSQITGSASSYARKYALNGLFLIDDTKDADSQDNTQKSTSKKETKEDELAKLTKEYAELRTKLTQKGIDFRSERMIDWFKKNLNIDQELSTDVEKMKKIVEAYKMFLAKK